MDELTPELKKHESDLLLGLDLEDFSNDVVPSDDDPDVAALMAELSTEPAVRIPAVDDDGLYGWPVDGVRARISKVGGSIRFGWRLRKWPGILLTAEFHAVWVDPDGAMVDITPTVPPSDTTLFAPVPDYLEDTDWDERPSTRHVVLYVDPDRSEEVAARIAGFTSGQRAYEERRARKAGLTLEAWVRDKLPPGPVTAAIDKYVSACLEFDLAVEDLPDMIADDPLEDDDDLVDFVPEDDVEEPDDGEGGDILADDGDDELTDADYDEVVARLQTEDADNQLELLSELRFAAREDLESLLGKNNNDLPTS